MASSTYSIKNSTSKAVLIENSDNNTVAIRTATVISLTDQQYQQAVAIFGSNNVTLITADIQEVSPAQYPFTPLPPRQSNVSIASATSLTAPSGATYAVVQVKVANALYTMDGSTSPTTSIGFPLSVGASLAVSGAAAIAAFKIIGSTSGATMDVEYFK